MSDNDSFTFLPLGALIHEFRVAGHNFVLSHPNEEDHKTTGNPAYLGETIGRVANRISDAKFKLNGKEYKLAANNGPNSLHGGPQGWGKQIWDGPKPTNHNGKEGVLFTRVSKDGEEGFPGTVEAKVWYTGYKEKDEGKEKTVLEVEYEAELIGDEVDETIVSMTNHSSFTVSDGKDMAGTEATLYTNLHQVTDSADIPTGEIAAFPGVEAGKMFVLGTEEPKIDHCMVMNPDPASVLIDTRPLPMKKLCAFYHPNSRMHFEALSTEPAFQFYTGEYIDVKDVNGKQLHGKRAGFCVEASRYINAPNVEKWRGMVVLKKGEKWGSKTVYRGWKD